MTTEQILSKLKGVKKRQGYHMALCPAHEDKLPSLSIKTGEDGRTLLKCQAGCQTNDILTAIGLELKDLFSDNGLKTEPRTYDYTDAAGKLLYQVVRKPGKDFSQRRPDGNGGWTWKGVEPEKRVPYRLPEIIKAVKADQPIFICEGEKDCDRLAGLGLTATTNSGGAGKWLDSLSAHFEGAKVVIFPDNDAPEKNHPLGVGREHAQAVAQSLHGIAAAVKIVDLPGLPEKGDVSDWLDAGHAKDELVEIVKEAPLWDPSITVTPLKDTSCNNQTWISLSKVELTEQRYVVEDFLPEHYVSALYADGGKGKSYIAMSLAVCVALGLPFLNRQTRQGKVLYIDYELEREEQRRRLERICKGLGVGVEKVDEPLSYLDTRDRHINIDELSKLLKDHDFSLIVIDSLGMALGGDPENPALVTQFFEHCKPLGTILVLDHQAKRQKGDRASDKTMFGSAFKQNWSRNIWHLNSSQKDEKTQSATLTHKKSNFSALRETVSFESCFDAGKYHLYEAAPSGELLEHLSIPQQILAAYQALGGRSCSNEIAEHTGLSIEIVRTRTSTLKTQGKLKDTGDKLAREMILELVKTNVTKAASGLEVNTASNQQEPNIITNGRLFKGNSNIEDPEIVQELKDTFGAKEVDLGDVPF